MAKAFNVQVRMKSLKTFVHLLQLTGVAIMLIFEDGIADSMLSQCETCRKDCSKQAQARDVVVLTIHTSEDNFRMMITADHLVAAEDSREMQISISVRAQCLAEALSDIDC